jgi:hypothetical protein
MNSACVAACLEIGCKLIILSSTDSFSAWMPVLMSMINQAGEYAGNHGQHLFAPWVH